MSKSVISNLLFVLFSTVIGGILGLFSSKLLIPKDAGLAGGAMVLFYGAIGLVLGLVISLILQRYISYIWKNRLNIIFALASLAFGVWIYQGVQKRKKENTETPSIPLQPSAPAPDLE